jgi:uncharacterized protein YyaL (SSP411 family)
LTQNKSPYLLQHAQNPVDWYPWGNEAFQKAKSEDKPIFLSIGYSTCHWCHVMAHESFEDMEVADLLNQNYVAIKVDREERPDIDQLYMAVCQALTGRGGWPLSIFMTPERKPFFAGTYFPKKGRMGISGFIEILKHIAILWEKDRDRIKTSGEMITNAIQVSISPKAENRTVDETTLKLGFEQLSHSFEPKWGGFSPPPKFPVPHNLTFLLRWFKRSGNPLAVKMVEKTLNGMRKGGIFDQVGFGFHRYSVDEKWLVPHFEKMLYDQALLALAYLEIFQITHNIDFKQTVEKIFTYVLRDLTSPEGGFYSAEDADSEGEEGRFYVWTTQEIKTVLGPELGELFCRFYNITPTGNFESGLSIPHETTPVKAFAEQEGIGLTEFKTNLEIARQKLFDAREKRIHPLKDDKIITSWNGLMIAAFAKGYQILGEQRYIDAARKSAQFILKKLRNPEGRVLRRFREKEVAFPGYLEDYAFLLWGLLELYEATFEIDYFEEAVIINNDMIDFFWDDKEGGFFYSGKGNETLIAQSKEVYDGALPSGNSVAALTMLRLSRMTGNVDLEKKVDRMVQTFSSQISAYPLTSTHFLQALDFALGPAQEIVIGGDTKNQTTQDMIRLVQKSFLPHKIVLLQSEGSEGERLAKLSSFITPMITCNQKPTVYVCERFSCKKPMTEVEELQSFLNTC